MVVRNNITVNLKVFAGTPPSHYEEREGGAQSTITRTIMSSSNTSLPISMEAALLFTSGYISNEATLSALAKVLPGCVIYSDALNHAIMIAGIRTSGCEKKVWRHDDLEHLEQLLVETIPPCRN